MEIIQNSAVVIFIFFLNCLAFFVSEIYFSILLLIIQEGTIGYKTIKAITAHTFKKPGCIKITNRLYKGIAGIDITSKRTLSASPKPICSSCSLRRYRAIYFNNLLPMARKQLNYHTYSQ